MFKPSTSVPKFGEIRLGCAPQDHALLGTHKYVGIHPYLVVSNDVYNKFSGQCDVIPFTTKRFASASPTHVDYPAGSIRGLTRDSTLVVEARDTLLNSQLGEPIARFSDENWQRAKKAFLTQNPFLPAGSSRNPAQHRLHSFSLHFLSTYVIL